MKATHGIECFSALKNIFDEPALKQCFVDTTVLFSQTYPLDPFHEETDTAFTLFTRLGVSVFTNINVRAEFLENHRRILIAESLIDLLEDSEDELEGVLVEKLKSHRTSFRRKVTEEKPAKIEVQQIKLFRKLLMKHSTANGNAWDLFCRNRLQGKLERIWEATEDELGLNFISLRSDEETPFLKIRPTWKDATSLMGRYGIASADAMILNMFFCSTTPVLLTADLEMAECAARESKGKKRVFVPDSLFASITTG
jgi:hypothetical protein